MRPSSFVLLCLALFVAAWSQTAPLRGYFADSSREERAWEAKFRALPDAAILRADMQRLAAHPHHVGSPYDKENADWILAQLQAWGLDAHIETFDVLFPTPKERSLELVAPTRFATKLQEPPVAGDPTSSQQTEQLPSYNAYSIDGDVTAPLVYVNYGIPEDYDALDRLGISVKGAIVIARYGSSWRGIKPKVAAEHGALGCLIYSDPRDDGFSDGDTFPNGPYRPRDGVQRGSVMDMPVYPGDPLTPGIGATKEARRLPLNQAVTLTRIPVLPISYGDAEPLLDALTGPVAPQSWRGALPVTYHIGPGPAKVHLHLEFNWDTKTIYDVIARIPGSDFPDEWVIRGNHHDAWVNGAEDPVSGVSAVLEEARSMAALLRQGWKPKRSIVLCFWDGEEPGLLGSTEWAETHADELTLHAAAYVNSDSNGRGYLNMSGSHTLEKFMNAVARDVDDPEAGVTVWKRLQARELTDQTPGAAAAESQDLRTRSDLRMSALGSGSDYTVFIDHLGIASLNLAYGGEDSGGIYHSIYDDFYWFTHFSDSDFTYGRALAQTAGQAVMRLADADILPFDFDDFTDTLRRYVNEVRKLASDARDRAMETNRRIDDGEYAATVDPRHKTVPPAREPVPPYLNFAPLDNGLAALQQASEVYAQAFARLSARVGPAPPDASLREANARLIAVDRALTFKGGLPNRDWFKNQIYAPGFYTGYGVKTLPGVRESIEQKQWRLADTEIAIAGQTLSNAAAAIESAAAALK